MLYHVNCALIGGIGIPGVGGSVSVSCLHVILAFNAVCTVYYCPTGRILEVFLDHRVTIGSVIIRKGNIVVTLALILV